MKTKAGKSYMSLLLADKTGSIDAKIWELGNHIHSFEAGDIIKVEGSVSTYMNELQFKITRVRKSEEGEYLTQDYVPSTDKDISLLYQQITDTIKTVESPYIRKLLEKLLVEDTQLAKAFQEHSAAKNMHHSYMGGLVEHTLSVVEICDFMSGRYKFVNRDILLAGAMLHDIGKVYELSDFPENDYTDAGELLGHIIIGANMVERTCEEIPGFPAKLKNLLIHCILSHHGEYEYGSPKLPKTIEAMLLHCCDNMDAKIKMFEEILEKDNTMGDWTGYNRVLSRNIRKSGFGEL